MDGTGHHNHRTRRRRLVVAVIASFAGHLALLFWLQLHELPAPARKGTSGGEPVEVGIVAAPPPLPSGGADAADREDPAPEPRPRARRSRPKPRPMPEPQPQASPSGSPEGTPEGTEGGVAGGTVGGRVGGEPGGDLGGGDRVTGNMVVRCVVAREGTLERCRVVKALPKVTGAVMEALRTWKLPPPTVQDRGRGVDHVITLRLILPER